MSFFDRVFERIILAFAVLAGAIFCAITIALTLNVAMRFFLGDSLYGMVDAIEMGLMAATFLAAPWVLHRNAHVAVDIFLTGLSAPGRRRVDIVSSAFGAVLSLVFAWASLKALLIALERGSMIRGVLVLPEWITLTAPVIGGFLLAIEFGRRMARGPAIDRQQAGL
ncbi:TRAP transporter small permease [Pararhizobium haloflavum]|uniref:TRAP transporter small permease n=1 Tax=Pararhizobium haloflavum TaxID=2037914 RepID=UPI000C188124|nr:TRAP transporter small permease [Pararhizobium haloflavum]